MKKDELRNVVPLRSNGVEEELAVLIRKVITSGTPLGGMLAYIIDSTGDLFLAEELYQKYPDLLSWIAKAGCREPEIVVRAFIRDNPQIFVCHDKECRGQIIGGCPSLYCEKCGRKYLLHLDHVTNQMCETCVARAIGECTERSLRSQTDIFGILPEQIQEGA